MKANIKTLDGPKINLDLTEIALIEQFGQRDSGAGWLQVKITMKSGVSVDTRMPVEDYDKLIVDWNPKTEATPK